MRVLQIAGVIVLLGSILVAAFGGGGLLLARNVPLVIEGWNSRSWPATPGEIKASAAVSRPIVTSPRRGAVGTHDVALRYVFAVNGRAYTGTRLGLDDLGVLRSQAHAERQADALQAGRSVDVFYDPDDPSRSLLIPGVPVAGVTGLIFGSLLIAGGLGLVAIALHLRAHHAKRRARRGA